MAKNIAIVATSWHQESMEVMVKEAKITSQKQGLKVVKEVWVPGCYEVPLALKRLFALTSIDGAVVLGIIEKGETKHGLIMGEVVHRAIVQLQLETDKPVGLAILGPEITLKQVPARAELYAKKSVLALSVMLKKP